MHFYVKPAHLNSTGHNSYAFLHGVHSPGRHFYAFLREACSSELPWGPFVCIFTCQPANPASQPSQPAHTASQPRQPVSPASQFSQPTQPASPASQPSQPAHQPTQPASICMHFYMVYTRLGSPGDHLYAFLHGVHSPGFRSTVFCMCFT